MKEGLLCGSKIVGCCSNKMELLIDKTNGHPESKKGRSLSSPRVI